MPTTNRLLLSAMTSSRVAYATRAARYLVLTLVENLPGARRFVAQAPINVDDAGPAGDFTVGVDDATETAAGVVRLAGDLSGSAESPAVVGLHLGTAEVTLGAVADGEALVRVGDTVVGAANATTTLAAHLAAGDPHPQYQLEAQKNTANGYAGVGEDLRIGAPQAPLKSVYASGGSQALTPGDINAVPTTRMITVGAGISGGGDLSANRSVAVAAFVGVVSKSINPGVQDYLAGSTVVHTPMINAGANGQILVTGLRLPPCIHADLRNRVVLILNSGSLFFENANTGAPLDLTLADLMSGVAGGLGSAPINNGRWVQSIEVRTLNVGVDRFGVDIAAFEVRGYGLPIGAGGVL